jgi:hypothetical protein
MLHFLYKLASAFVPEQRDLKEYLIKERSTTAQDLKDSANIAFRRSLTSVKSPRVYMIENAYIARAFRYEKKIRSHFGIATGWRKTV